jgi:phosphoserine phosphatase
MRFFIALLTGLFLATAPVAAQDPLPSWRQTAAKERILAFVHQVTSPKSQFFVPREDRIAVFDNDGTLLLEQPIYVEVAQVIDRLKSIALTQPSLRDVQPYKAALDNDIAAIAAMGSSALFDLVAKTNAGMSPDEFRAAVDAWFKTTRHPRFGKPLDQLTYQPMLELIRLLKKRGFKVYIVTGSGVEFVRAFSQRAYGIPPENVIGSTGKLAVVKKGETLTLLREPQIDRINDGPGKVIGISETIGKRPILAVGNSDGDYQMLQWTTEGAGARLGALLHHDDAKREYHYDRTSSVGRLNRGLDDASARNWLIISMDKDWKRIFP